MSKSTYADIMDHTKSFFSLLEEAFGVKLVYDSVNVEDEVLQIAVSIRTPSAFKPLTSAALPTLAASRFPYIGKTFHYDHNDLKVVEYRPHCPKFSVVAKSITHPAITGRYKFSVEEIEFFFDSTKPRPQSFQRLKYLSARIVR